MREAADRDDAHALVTHDVRFHRIIVEASGNQTLLEIWTSLRVEARTVITMVKDQPDLHEIAEMHRAADRGVPQPGSGRAAAGCAQARRALREMGADDDRRPPPRPAAVPASRRRLPAAGAPIDATNDSGYVSRPAIIDNRWSTISWSRVAVATASRTAPARPAQPCTRPRRPCPPPPAPASRSGSTATPRSPRTAATSRRPRPASPTPRPWGSARGGVPDGARVEFLHAPTSRTVQTAEALRRGVERALAPGAGVRLGAPRVERAIRNPDLYVAGNRVEMVSASTRSPPSFPTARSRTRSWTGTRSSRAS